MLKIKLARFGKRNQPHYRIVVNEARDKRDGSYVDNLGHYAPTQTPKLLDVDVKKYDDWVSKGAIPTDTVKGLVERFKSGDPFPAKKPKLSKKTKAKQAAEAEAKAEATEAAAEQPAEEKAADNKPAEDTKPEAAEAAPKTEPEAEVENTTSDTDKDKS